MLFNFWSKKPRQAEVVEHHEIGDMVADGSYYVGLTPDGKNWIFAMPANLGVPMTYVDTQDHVRKINRRKYLGHKDWKIPTLDQAEVMMGNRKGSFRESFGEATIKRYPDGLVSDVLGKKIEVWGDCSPGWYWTTHKCKKRGSAIVWAVSGYGSDPTDGCWNHEQNARVDCRAVRIVPVGRKNPF